MKSILYIVTGLPGSGKTTVANRLVKPTSSAVYSADDYFTDSEGVYRFDPSRLSDAHATCQEAVNADLAGFDTAVANTFTQFWEVAPYLVIAKRHSARVVIVDCYDGGMTDYELAGKNVHGVPESAIKAMRARWEFNKHSGDARPPWERK